MDDAEGDLVERGILKCTGVRGFGKGRFGTVQVDYCSKHTPCTWVSEPSRANHQTGKPQVARTPTPPEALNVQSTAIIVAHRRPPTPTACHHPCVISIPSTPSPCPALDAPSLLGLFLLPGPPTCSSTLLFNPIPAVLPCPSASGSDTRRLATTGVSGSTLPESNVLLAALLPPGDLTEALENFGEIGARPL